MNLRTAAAAFAASYFFIVFLKDGTVASMVKDAEHGLNTLLKSSKRLTKLT